LGRNRNEKLREQASKYKTRGNGRLKAYVEQGERRPDQTGNA